MPHHCYNCIPMMDSSVSEAFNVRKWREMALAAISEVHKRGNTPIVCGGTNYWVEMLLFSGERIEVEDMVEPRSFNTAKFE